jgi:hypothetical protein
MSFQSNDGPGSSKTMTQAIKDRFFHKRSANGQTRRAFLAGAGGILSTAMGSHTFSQASSLSTTQHSIRWLAFYGITADESILATYDLVVLDPGYQGSINLIARTGTKVCG